MFLPGTNGTWVAEGDGGGAGAQPVDPAAAARQWLCYAWPEVARVTGLRTFILDHRGDVIASDDGHPYGGDKAPVAGVAGFVPGSTDWAFGPSMGMSRPRDAFGTWWRGLG